MVGALSWCLRQATVDVLTPGPVDANGSTTSNEDQVGPDVTSRMGSMILPCCDLDMRHTAQCTRSQKGLYSGWKALYRLATDRALEASKHIVQNSLRDRLVGLYAVPPMLQHSR